MRLICPRCSEKYEIDDELIPPTGREVECSSCESTWFQAGKLRMTSQIEAKPTERTSPSDETPPPEDAEDDSHLPPLPQPSKALAPDLLSLLRDEAKQFEADNPELNSEKVIAEAPASAEIAIEDAKPVAEATQESAAVPIQEPAKEAPRTPAPAAPETIIALSQEPATSKKSGFGKGFIIGIAISLALFGLYRFAPHAGEGSIGDALRSFHDAGNQLNLWVGTKLDDLAGR